METTALPARPRSERRKLVAVSATLVAVWILCILYLVFFCAKRPAQPQVGLRTMMKMAATSSARTKVRIPYQIAVPVLVAT